VLALFYWELKRVKERGDMSRRTLFKKKKRDRKISFFFFSQGPLLLFISLFFYYLLWLSLGVDTMIVLAISTCVHVSLASTGRALHPKGATGAIRQQLQLVHPLYVFSWFFSHRRV
jgi:hypothetical protein